MEIQRYFDNIKTPDYYHQECVYGTMMLYMRWGEIYGVFSIDDQSVCIHDNRRNTTTPYYYFDHGYQKGVEKIVELLLLSN